MNNGRKATPKNETGRTPSQERDHWQAMKLKRDILISAGELVYRSDVAAATSKSWNAAANDLRYSLPGEVADRLTGQAPAAAVRAAVRAAVEAMIENWKKTCPESVEGVTAKRRRAAR